MPAVWLAAARHTGVVTSDVRREYNIARGYLSALEMCCDHLDRMGVDRAWTASARNCLEHIAGVLADGVEFAERRGEGDEPSP